MTVRAIFEGGVFRPVGVVDLPDHTPVEFELHVPQPTPPSMSPGLAKIYGVLGRRHESGHTDTAERHNEHQP